MWLLLTEPTYNRTRRTALAWRARILSQKALPNVAPFRPPSRFSLPSDEPTRVTRTGAHATPRFTPLSSRQDEESQKLKQRSAAPSDEAESYDGERWEYRARNLKKVAGMGLERDFNEHGAAG
jgi:hypothetical protein